MLACATVGDKRFPTPHEDQTVPRVCLAYLICEIIDVKGAYILIKLRPHVVKSIPFSWGKFSLQMHGSIIVHTKLLR